MNKIYIILIAYVLDILIGDPVYSFHPVRLMGNWITILESFLRKTVKNEKLAGLLLWLMVVVPVYLSGFFLIKFMFSFSKVLAMIISAILVYTCLAVKDLNVQAMRVYKALRDGELELARSRVAMIVGRDTGKLNEQEIIRATVETVSESIVDGIVSPLFFAFIGGAPLVLAYKAVNTLDSMVGYMNDKYKDFGFVSAKMDDVANFFPARISGLLIPVASILCAKDSFSSFKIMLRDRKKHPSPNSAISEAAVAGALNIQLGGENYYKGVLSQKPLLGDKNRELCIKDIRSAIIICHITTFLVVVIGCLLTICLGRQK